jgi:hypothetical protein
MRDLGTDLLLPMGMVVADRLVPARTVLVFGAFQVLTRPISRLPRQQLCGGVVWRLLSA